MITVKQIERAWNARQYQRLFRELVACRPEASLNLEFDGGWAAPAAAMAVIRLDELSQSHVPACAMLIRCLIASQQPDGGWGDLLSTALCLRALLCRSGQGLAIDRGMDFLANFQKTDGLWPRFPLRRLPEDAFVSAFILYQLGDQPAFQSAVRLDDALAWFQRNQPFLDLESRGLYERATHRCHLHAPVRDMLAASWS